MKKTRHLRRGEESLTYMYCLGKKTFFLFFFVLFDRLIGFKDLKNKIDVHVLKRKYMNNLFTKLCAKMLIGQKEKNFYSSKCRLCLFLMLCLDFSLRTIAFSLE